MTVAAVGAKLALYLVNLPQEKMAMYTIFMLLLVILVGSFFTVRKFKMISSDIDMKSLVKAGMKSTTLFAVFMGIFVFIYYSYIDTHYFPDLIADRIELAKAAAVENPDINLENVQKMGEMWFSPKTHATITLFGLTVAGAIYSFFISLFMRKVRGFGKN